MIRSTSDKFGNINSLASHWGNTMPKKPRKKGGGPEWREWNGLISLLNEFSNFVPKYQSLLGKVPSSVNPGFLRNQGPQRLLESFSIISRACEQRRGKVTNDSMPTYLAQAEDILESYCERWNPYIKGEDRYEKLETPVAYFDKLFGITRALYVPKIPIISIPLTDYNQPDHWQALAHEFGHHIYWNALVSINDVDDVHKNLIFAIQKQITTESAGIWSDWLEEVFADICGTLFAGPSYVISCQDLAAEQAKTLNDFLADDGEHPSLYIRPLITGRVLEEIIAQTGNAELQSLNDIITIRWRGFNSSMLSQLKDDTVKNKLITLTAEVPAVVSAILHEPCWPISKTLLELVDYYGKNLLSPQDIEELNRLKGAEVLQPDHVGKSVVASGPLDDDIPDNLKSLWGFIKARLGKRSGQQIGDPLDEWIALLELGFEEGHTHFFPHTWLTRHFPWGRLHRHAAGSKIIFG